MTFYTVQNTRSTWPYTEHMQIAPSNEVSDRCVKQLKYLSHLQPETFWFAVQSPLAWALASELDWNKFLNMIEFLT